MHQGYDVLAGGLAASGDWELLDPPNDSPDRKNHTYGHTEFMFSGGERGGPLATYLATAAARPGFNLWTDTAARRIVREGARATGVEVSCALGTGHAGTVYLTPDTGRVIVSAGTFGTPKVLFRSACLTLLPPPNPWPGEMICCEAREEDEKLRTIHKGGIGPTDQLTVVQNSTDGPTMIGQEDWIDLPVGYNLAEQMNTDMIVTHPEVVFYDFYGAWDDPIQADKDAYLGNRTGILTQAAPNIGPMVCPSRFILSPPFSSSFPSCLASGDTKLWLTRTRSLTRCGI